MRISQSVSVLTLSLFVLALTNTSAEAAIPSSEQEYAGQVGREMGVSLYEFATALPTLFWIVAGGVVLASMLTCMLPEETESAPKRSVSKSTSPRPSTTQATKNRQIQYQITRYEKSRRFDCN